MKSDYTSHLSDECSHYGVFAGKDNAFSSDRLECLDRQNSDMKYKHRIPKQVEKYCT